MPTLPFGAIGGKSAGKVLKQRKEAYKRLEEAEATVKYMDGKAAHYEEILAGLAPDDTNPNNRTAETRPRHETNKGAK